jgi:hypothetical protein
MTPEQQAIADTLAPEMVRKIDAELLLHARPHERKVAMIIGLAMSNPELRVPGLPDIYYAQRVKALVETGRLLAEGNLNYMRYSEVRLPERQS